MAGKDEIREFLRSRRAKITPDQAGLPVYGGGRRVPGLRREEVAMLAGVSNDYYARLERGNLGGVSESVLESLARALQLDDAERTHLYDLARAAGPLSTKPRRRPTAQQVRPSVLQILDGMTGTPAYVRNGRRDILAANALGRALYAVMWTDGSQPPNVARFVFLDERAPTFFPEWERVADDAVAALRIEAGKDPHDRALSDLVGELTTRSEAFAQRWARHDVHLHRSGRKRLLHPVVGELELTFEVMDLSADQGLTINAYAAEAGSRSAEGLALLASWAATPDAAPDPAPDALVDPVADPRASPPE